MSNETLNQVLIDAAAEAVSNADAVLVTAGAGMGVDSGLPDFRGDEGFWKAYPPFKAAGLNFMAMANPSLFETAPDLAWGFYGHRMNLYSATKPHEGYSVLRRFVGAAPMGGRVYTSNVDGAFVKAGFSPSHVAEIHGALSHVQCTRQCGVGLLSSEGLVVDVDLETFRARGELPSCPQCGALLRPNVLMFGDGRWDPSRSELQSLNVTAWLRTVSGGKLVVIECGAGTAIASIRHISEIVSQKHGAKHIRINLRESEGDPGTLSIPMGAKAALLAIESRIIERSLAG